MRTFTFVLLLMVVSTFSWAQTKLLRFPDIYENEVVFCYGGDLWKAPASGGTATRLTAHPGQELFPKFSPDGQWIAFTGQYDGDEQVYVMPTQGGVPTPLTYYPARGPLAPRWGYDHQVYGWTPDGEQIFFRSLRDANGGRTESALYTVPMEGGLPEKLPMPTSGAGDFSPDGSKMVYSPLFRDFRTWKRYQGGWAQYLYIFDLETYDTQRIAYSERTERDPMWIGDDIYFVSDRDGTLNLYTYKVEDESVEQLTTSTTWDVRWPSSDNSSQIVYEFNGELHVYNVATESDTKISIFVPDDGLSKRPSRYSAAENIEDFELSPKGNRALFTARGDIFTVPIEHGPTRNLTNSSNAHDKWAEWSPDGEHIAYISDVTGEEQIYLIKQDGSEEPQQLTTDLNAMLFSLRWSPDGKYLSFTDKDGQLFLLNIESKAYKEIADDQFAGGIYYDWSPNGGYVALTLGNRNNFNSLYIYSVAEDKLTRITDDMFNVYDPAWGANGDYLYYLSDRSYAPQLSHIEWNFALNREVGLFAMALRKDVKHPFAPKSDEVALEEAEEKDDEKEQENGEQEEKEYISIDFDGLAERTAKIPVDFENYTGLSAIDGHLLFMKRGASFYGRQTYDPTSLHIYDLKEREESTLVDKVSTYALSHDGKKILVREGGAYKLYDAKPKTADPKTVSTSELMMDRIPQQEWETIFEEVWRRYRDFFYVDNMHGYDWEAIGEQYRSLLKYVAHRSDLNYVISEMIAELNVGHAYIQGGDYEIPERPKVALPGARFELDENSNRYRINKIFHGDNEEPKYRAPLTEIGVDINVGDYVLAIDGEELVAPANPYKLLQHKTHPVTFMVNSKPDTAGARQVTYNPITSEASLLYKEWVDGNRKKVAEMTDGQVGYIHIPDMSANGIYEFIKWFYPQLRKGGMVVDVRSNGGGNVSQWIIERLDTELLGTRFGYYNDEPRTYPYTVFHGHLVCLLNETSASDGDIFPHRFRKAGLGPLIGKRSWGGVVGISSRGPLLDGGTVFVPLQATNDVDGDWIIEGYGVEPDIKVENDPKSVLEGRDPQLERGVQEVMKQIEANPMKLPERPPAPVKTD